jgi:hypothetical protein
MAAKAAGPSFDDFPSWSEPATNYKRESDCRAVWKSFRENGAVIVNTFYTLAFPQGWKDPAKRQNAVKGSYSCT